MCKEVNSGTTGVSAGTDSVVTPSEEGVVVPPVGVEDDDWLFYSDL